MMRTKQLTMIAALAVAIAAAAPAAQAQGWEYDLYIYVHGASIDGITGIGPIDAEVDVSFSDILDNLEFGAMGSFRAKKNDWAVMTDVIFTAVAVSGERAVVDVDMLILEVDGAYQFTDSAEFLFGVRGVDVDAGVVLLGPLGLAGSSSKNWVDPVLGLRVEAPTGDKWIFVGRLDIGGFGVGSDFSYQVALHFGYRVGKSSTVTFGWRHLDIDYEDGEGLNRFKFDVAISGPQLGFAFHF